MRRSAPRERVVATQTQTMSEVNLMPKMLNRLEPAAPAPAPTPLDRPPTTASAGQGEALAFRAALAVIALAVADDAFVHPEQGTSASDHFVSGFVPIAIATGLALAYPRFRAGLRGAIAIACGLPALTAGVADGARHVLVDRLAGDDLSVMAAGVAGAVLVGIGVATLWRNRRHEERPLRRYGRRVAVVALTAAGVLFV